MHGIRCNAEKERRLTTSEVEFVADSNQAEVRFACCFCRRYYESVAEFTAHIGEHLPTPQVSRAGLDYNSGILNYCHRKITEIVAVSPMRFSTRALAWSLKAKQR